MPIHRFIVEEREADTRLDSFLAAKLPAMSRSRLQKAVFAGEVRVDEQKRKPSYRLQPGNCVVVDELPRHPDEFWLTPEAIPLDVVFEDEYLLVVNKPRGMVTHPAVGSRRGTLVNALLGYSTSLSSVNASFRPGILHRLDKDTSGLLIVAKTDEAHFALAKQMERRQVHRRYLALVWGETKWQHVRVEAPIDRSENDRKKMAVTSDGREAVTEFDVKERFLGFTLLEATLHTGRTHQVRVHAQFAKHPVVGDAVYGGLRPLPKGLYPRESAARIGELIHALDGQALVAYRIGFLHPLNGEEMTFEIGAPGVMGELIESLERPDSNRATTLK